MFDFAGPTNAANLEGRSVLTFLAARRALVTLAAGALLAGGLVPVQTAEADSDCYVELDAPSRVAIRGPYRDVEVGLIDSCGVATYASIDLYGPRGWDNIFIFDGDTTQHWDVYDWQTTGDFETRLSSAHDWDYNDLDFVPTNITVKYGSKASISTKRSGRKVTLKATSKSYSPAIEGYKAWNASAAELEYRNADGWQHLKWVTLKSGKATYTFKKSTKRDYRFVTYDGTQHFGASSTPSRR